MESRIARELKLRNEPVAIIFTDQKPESAIQFKEGGRGCVIALFSAAARGRMAVMDRETVGCTGGFTGLGFGCRYENMPGGIEYFLSTGRGEGYPAGEGYKKTPELAKDFVDKMPVTDIPYEYVVFKPLSQVDPEAETPVVIGFLATPDQLSALVVLANYGVAGNENVVVPFAAGCATVCLLPYQESKREQPRAVVGLVDISARPFVDSDLLAFSVPFEMFKRMEDDIPGSFLERHDWRKVHERIPEPRID